MHGMSLREAWFQQTTYFSPLTHPQLLHKMKTRPLTVVEHFYGKVEYIQLIFLTFTEHSTQRQESLAYLRSHTPDLIPAYKKVCKTILNPCHVKMHHFRHRSDSY